MIKECQGGINKDTFRTTKPKQQKQMQSKSTDVLSDETIRLAWSSNLSVGCIDC